MTDQKALSWLVLLLAWLLIPPAYAQSTAAGFDWVGNYSDYEQNRFALEMPMTDDNLDTLKKHLRRYRYLLLYLPANEMGDVANPNMRIGLFARYTEAMDFLRASQYLFRQQHIVRVSVDEHRQIIHELKPADPAAANVNNDQRLLVFAIDPENNQQLQHLQQTVLDRAKALYLSGDYQTAAYYYRLLASFGADDFAAWAGELAGLCYEKMRRRELAMTQYREVLQRFPDSSGVARVTQRLRGLETASDDDPAARKAASSRDGLDFFTRGVFGQYYRSVNRQVGDADSEEVLRLLSTDWDVRSSLRWQAHDLNLRFSGYWLQDELDNDDELAVKRLLLDYRHQTSGIGAVLGRQRDSDTGVFTSFDGVTASYAVADNLRVAASAGEPIYHSDAYDGLDYFFYSVHSLWDIDERWQLGGYVVTQEVNDVTDREAVGLRGRFSGDKLIVSLNLDYDTAFSELNNLLFNAHYRFNGRMDITLLYGSQRSPFLSATNILIGQADLDLNAYLKIKENRDTLLDDAFARTALNDYYNISFSTLMSDDVRWVIDYYDSTLSDVPSSEFLLGLTPTGADAESFHYQSVGSQLIFQNAFVTNDSASLGVRLASGDTSDSNQIYFYERLRLGTSWTVMPKLMYSEIEFNTSNEVQQQLRYSLSVSYRPWRNIEFNLEAGNESISSEQADIDFDSNYIFAGYRINF